MAVRPEGFVELSEFSLRMKDLMTTVRNEPARPGCVVMLPGDPEKRAMATRSRHGIPVDVLTWQKFCDLTGEFGVELPVDR